MWICNHCHAENKDGYSSCENCGANRSAGRFGSAPTVLTARPQAAPAPHPNAGQPLHQYINNPNPPQSRRPQGLPPRYMQGLGKVIGWALMILLPLLCALLAWRQYHVLSGVLVPLLLDAGAAEIWKTLCYIGFALIAVLLSFLPGLRTLMQCAKRPSKRKSGK